LPKDRRQNSRNERDRFTASSSCLPPVGPVARRDGGGGHRARELHATNFSDAAQAGAAPTEVALGWLLKRSSATILIPGTSSIAHLLEEHVAACGIALSAADMDALERLARSTSGRTMVSCL
jgi:aryl-alcohol dehydrogenase-like predicted oxidoreductase